MSRVLDVPVEAGSNEPAIPLCTFGFKSKSGITTDLVVGPIPANAISEASKVMPGHGLRTVVGLGDHASFYKARNLDDGNSVMFVESGRRGLLIGSEFVTEPQAERLARIVLRNW